MSAMPGAEDIGSEVGVRLPIASEGVLVLESMADLGCSSAPGDRVRVPPFGPSRSRSTSTSTTGAQAFPSRRGWETIDWGLEAHPGSGQRRKPTPEELQKEVKPLQKHDPEGVGRVSP